MYGLESTGFGKEPAWPSSKGPRKSWMVCCESSRPWGKAACSILAFRTVDPQNDEAERVSFLDISIAA
jgi:hypothetical protein